MVLVQELPILRAGFVEVNPRKNTAMEQKNYYEILGVPETASEEDIRRAFRTQAKECHPDHHPGDAAAEARFKAISEAYEVLGDAEQRRTYDELRRYSMGGGPSHMSYEEFASRFGGRSGGPDRDFFGFGRVSMDDLFNQLFRGGGFRVDSSQESWTGGSAQDNEPRPTSDSFFRHVGLDAYADITVNLAQLLLGSTIRLRTPTGGKVKIRIPAGTQPDTRLRVPGQGYTAHGNRGDLYVTLHLRMPDSLSESEQTLVRQLAESRGWKY